MTVRLGNMVFGNMTNVKIWKKQVTMTVCLENMTKVKIWKNLSNNDCLLRKYD